MITVYGLAQSRSFRLVWLLELLAVEYELVQFSRDNQSLLAPQDLKDIHPLGKAPLLKDGDLVLAESGAIVDYLIRTYGQGKFMPKEGTNDYWEYQRWLHYAEGSLMPLLLMSLVFHKIETAPMPFFAKPIAKKISGKAMDGFIHPQIELHLSYIDTVLAKQDYFAGDVLSGADIMMSYPLLAVSVRGDLSRYPHIAAYLHRIEQDSAYQSAIIKAGQPIIGM